ncbi:MAG TPA: SH3 domain-containing protein [Candidatus Dormibacteraeota bacterium]|nr:SH3 domain-containing protein [Candidatus Dormibacteraeota bacterium]
MKKTCWLLFTTLVSASLLAQTATNTPAISDPTLAAPKTNAPAAKSTKKKSEKKAASTTKKKNPAAELRTIPLVAGPATVVASNVNVRGQAKLNSEVITKLTKGDTVNVLEEITLKKSGPDEPSAWAKIVLPAKAHAWVNTSFIEQSNKTVIPKKLKLRGGPGENYSVLGFLKRGDSVKDVATKGDWTEIEAPAEAYAFMAAQYLSQENPPTITAPEPPATPTVVTDQPPVVAATTEPVVPTPPPTIPTEPVLSNAPPTVPDIPTPVEPAPPRIVQREGFVRGTFSIQAPTRFELINPDNRNTMNYLHTTSPNLDLARYKGLRILVTGEEGLDERWRNTPVLTVQKIQVLE